MAFVACVMKHRPLKLDVFRKKGRAPQWSRWKWLTSSRSISPATATSKNGSDASPVIPGWMPQSSIIFFPLYSSIIHDRPTSWPAPSGLMTNWSLSSGGTFVALLFAVPIATEDIMLSKREVEKDISIFYTNRTPANHNINDHTNYRKEPLQRFDLGVGVSNNLLTG